MGLRLARWTGHEMPTLIHTLVATAIVRRTLWGAETLLWESPPDPAAEDALRAELEALQFHDLYHTALRGERAASFGAIMGTTREETSFLLRPWVDWNAALYVDSVTRILDDCAKPAHAREVVNEGGERIREIYGPRRGSLAQKLVQPFFFDACNKRDALRTYVDLFDLALRWSKHLRATGNPPASLAELGEIPTDPFSGEPYRLAEVDGAPTVYGVGGNLEDDGGRRPSADLNPALRNYTQDMVWRLPVDAGSGPADGD